MRGAGNPMLERAIIELAVVRGVLADDAMPVEGGAAAVLRAWSFASAGATGDTSPLASQLTAATIVEPLRAHVAERDLDAIRADLEKLVANPYETVDRAMLRRHAAWLDGTLGRLAPGPPLLSRRARAWLAAHSTWVIAVSAIGVFCAGLWVIRRPAAIWRASYFPNVDLVGDPSMQFDRAVDFDWGDRRPRYDLSPTNYSVRWESCLRLETDEHVSFFLGSDDGARLYVDGALVVDNWGDHGFRDVSTGRTLTPGAHALRVDYYQRDATAHVRLRLRADDHPAVVLERLLVRPVEVPGPRNPHAATICKE